MILLVAIIVALFITNVPAAILSLTFSDQKRSNLTYQIFRAVANNLEFLSFGLNFVLYFLFSKDIRKTFMSVVKSMFRNLWSGKKVFGTKSKMPTII